MQIYSQDVFHYSNEELAEFLDNNNFDMIGLGFLAARYVETVRSCRGHYGHKKKAKFVVGGHGVTPISEYILNDTGRILPRSGSPRVLLSRLLMPYSAEERWTK